MNYKWWVDFERTHTHTNTQKKQKEREKNEKKTHKKIIWILLKILAIESDVSYKLKKRNNSETDSIKTKIYSSLTKFFMIQCIYAVAIEMEITFYVGYIWTNGIKQKKNI